MNKPRGGGERPVDAPTIDELTLRAVCFREEFEDVVLLREVHRVVRDDDEVVRNMTEEEKAEYMRQAKKFEGVTKRMSDLSWVAQDHARLAGWRNRSALERTEKGREELKAFETAPLLMDAKKQKTGSDGGDGADKMNGFELEELARRTNEPIASFRAHHDKPDKETDLVVEDMDAEEFRGLAGALMLCVGARVLLTHNLWACGLRLV